MLLYLPLEFYPERYTSLLSARDGWIESKLLKARIPFHRVEGNRLHTNGIGTGQVLDAHGRAHWSLTQIAKVVGLMYAGFEFDTIYLDDFWTPGLEAIPYVADQLGREIKIYAMLHAQSVDKYDFTAKMKRWMRHYEIGQSKYMAGIFVTSEYLMDLCVEAGLENVHYGGLPFNAEWMDNNFPKEGKAKENKIIYTSRFDDEKNPCLFVELAAKLHGRFKFVMTTSAKELRSNNPRLLEIIRAAQEMGYIEIKTGLTKQEYYAELETAKYQVNTAAQDWVSWTLIEATHFGCIPVYPRYRSFPEVLDSKYLYEPGNVESMIRVIEANPEFDSELKKIPEHFDQSFERMLKIIYPAQP